MFCVFWHNNWLKMKIKANKSILIQVSEHPIKQVVNFWLTQQPCTWQQQGLMGSLRQVSFYIPSSTTCFTSSFKLIAFRNVWLHVLFIRMVICAPGFLHHLICMVIFSALNFITAVVISKFCVSIIRINPISCRRLFMTAQGGLARFFSFVEQIRFWWSKSRTSRK